MAKPKVTELDLESRLKASVKNVAASLNPVPYAAPPKKEEEIIPDLRELIPSGTDRVKLTRLITAYAEYGEAEKEAKKAKEPLALQIKAILGKHEVGKAQYDGFRINYYNAPRSTLSREQLLAHGVSSQILTDCTVTKDSYTLRITAPGADDDEK